MRQALSAAFTVALAACGNASGTSAPEPPSALHVSISRPLGGLAPTLRHAINSEPAADRVKSVHLTVGDDSGRRTSKKLVESGFPSTTAFDDLLPGEYTVSAYALDNEEGPFDGHTLYSTSARISVPPRTEVATNLILQELAPGGGAITAPFIHAITVAGGAPVIGKPLHLTATVRGAPSQTYLWKVSCADEPTPEASFTNPTGIATDLTLHRCSGDAIVTFSVTNPGVPHANGSLTSAVQFTLGYVPQGVDVTITTNSWPNITSIGTASNTAPLPGDTVRLDATAFDPDGDSLVYSWADDCGGSFSGEHTLTPIWTAPAAPGAVCELELTVREAGNEDGHNDGLNSGTFTLQVAPTVS